MGFFDMLRSGRLFFGQKEAPTIIVQFLFKGEKYIVEEFDLEFKQDVNEKGKPDSFPYGGQMAVTFSEIPSENINTWMMNSYSVADGEIRFLKNDGMIKEGALLQLYFKEAYCINYRKIMKPNGLGVLTSLVISPRIIKVGNEELRNSWT